MRSLQNVERSVLSCSCAAALAGFAAGCLVGIAAMGLVAQVVREQPSVSASPEEVALLPWYGEDGFRGIVEQGAEAGAEAPSGIGEVAAAEAPGGAEAAPVEIPAAAVAEAEFSRAVPVAGLRKRPAGSRLDERFTPRPGVSLAERRNPKETRVPEPEKPAAPACAAPIPEISAQGEGVWSIERDLLDAYAGDLDAIQSLAGWVGRHRDEEGNVDGFVIRGIECGGVLHQAGLRSGDVIESVNGRNVHTIPQALAAWVQLRDEPVIELRISRRGADRTLTYHLS